MPPILKNEKISQHTTFKIGGLAEHFCLATNPEELLAAWIYAKKNKLPFTVIAGGSNMVFRDRPKLSGLLVVCRKKSFDEADIEIKKNILTVNSAVYLDALVAKSTVLGFSGLENLSGIPGTLSGAIVGNAGAYGHSISEVIKEVEIFDGKKTRWITREECKFGYRDSVFKKKKWLVLRAKLSLKKSDASGPMETRKKILDDRWSKYPKGLLCPGSFFKNVLVKKVSKASLSKVDQNKIIDGKIPAGYLLAEAGAKGLRVGGIYVADYHGNLIINDGTGKFSDVVKLVAKMKKLVQTKFGIALEEEVRFVV